MGGNVKITKIKVGLGNTDGPTYAPLKGYIEIEADVLPDENGQAEQARLEAYVSTRLWNMMIDQLTKFKGAESASKFREEKKNA